MAEAAAIDGQTLSRRWPLRAPEGTSDKDDRGNVVVVGGARGTPGAVVLGGLAALRVGAGKLTIATADAHAAALGVATPEAAAFGLATTDAGAISPGAAGDVLDLAEGADAVLLGPGMADPEATAELVTAILRDLDDSPVVVIDAMAATCGALGKGLGDLASRCVVTPNSKEVAYLLDDTEGDDTYLACRLADRYGVVAVLNEVIATPDGAAWTVSKGNPGLGTSGSGDVLAGVVAGVGARTGDPVAAAIWGRTLHGAAGDRLAARIGRVGFLARELLDELPGCLRDLSAE